MQLKIILPVVAISLVIIIVVFIIIKSKKSAIKKGEELIEKEFEEGKIILPIDKRDFENFKDFKKKTSHIPDISGKIETIKEDFRKFEFINNNVKK